MRVADMKLNIVRQEHSQTSCSSHDNADNNDDDNNSLPPAMAGFAMRIPTSVCVCVCEMVPSYAGGGAQRRLPLAFSAAASFIRLRLRRPGRPLRVSPH